MKIIEIDFMEYMFPEGIDTIEGFIEYLNNNYGSFIPILKFQTENCKFPYLIKDDVKTVYLNVSKIESVNEAEIDVLSRKEYDARLKEVVAEKCVDCEYYTEDTKGDNLKGHREKLSLDGECRYYKKKSE